MNSMVSMSCMDCDSANVLVVEALVDLPMDLPNQEDLNEKTFGAMNIDRILKKFHCCVFKQPADDVAMLGVAEPDDANPFKTKADKGSSKSKTTTKDG